ncbi:hypothetical protein EBX93_04980 [bacterium]|nr:hypothetical protein [bacterium]
MSKKDEALKLAMEALEEIHPGNMTPMAEGNWNKAIIAIREALAEQPARQQEPVACAAPMACSGADKCVFRTSPPASKPWVGLTDEERNAIGRHHAYVDNIIRATEAKLWEKNA